MQLYLISVFVLVDEDGISTKYPQPSALWLFLTPNSTLESRKTHGRPELVPPSLLLSSSSSWLLLSSSHSALSSSSPRIPKLTSQPIKAIPPNTPHAKASPFGCTCVAMVNRPPERNGPAALPAAEMVWAMPLSVPRTALLGAEFVTYTFH